MKHFACSLLVLLAATLGSACAQSTKAGPPPTTTSGQTPAFVDACLGKPSNWEGTVTGYLGVTLPEAKAQAHAEGVTLRVLGRDGSCPIRTADRDPNRVDVYVVSNTVVRAVKG